MPILLLIITGAIAGIFGFIKGIKTPKQKT